MRENLSMICLTKNVDETSIKEKNIFSKLSFFPGLCSADSSLKHAILGLINDLMHFQMLYNKVLMLLPRPKRKLFEKIPTVPRERK